MVPASAHRHLSGKIQPVTRCSKGKKGEEKICAPFNPANGFLKTRFLPVRENKYPVLKNHRMTEKEFFNSLSNLSRLYQFEMPSVNVYPFPVNIALAFRQFKQFLKQMAPDLELIILHDENHRACLATVKTFSTGNTLYYIPVRPLVDLLKQKENRPLANLVLSVFSYLHHVVKIPWFTGNDNYLSDCYSVLKDWYSEDTDPEEELSGAEMIAHFNSLEKAGIWLHRRINAKANKENLKKRINKFLPVNKKEALFHSVAQELNALAEKFPGRSVFSSIPENLLQPDEDTRISPEHYLSFFWDSDDIICDQLMEYISNHLQECTVIDDPAAIQYFDEPQDKPLHDLEFEIRLFKAIDDLCTALKEIQHD